MNALTIGSAVLMGLFGGVHCIGMCGPISAGLCASSKRPTTRGSQERGSWAAAKWSVAYNLGRVTTYGLLGALVGTIGAQLVGPPTGASSFWMKCLSAVAVLAVGVHMSGLIHLVAPGRAADMGRMAQRIKRVLPVRSRGVAIGLGMLWGLLPCGLVYGALLLALSSGSAGGGATVMVAFGLGTFPLLFGIGYLGTRALSSLKKPIWRKTAGLTLLIAGTLQLSAIVGDSVLRADGAAPTVSCH